MQQIKKNDPAEWRRNWLPEGLCNTGSATYPTDGRETIYDPYEPFGATTTIGQLLSTYEAALPRDFLRPEHLPEDFAAYILQRVPTFFGLEWQPAETPIDRFGRFGTPPAKADPNT